MMKFSIAEVSKALDEAVESGRHAVELHPYGVDVMDMVDELDDSYKIMIFNRLVGEGFEADSDDPNGSVWHRILDLRYKISVLGLYSEKTVLDILDEVEEAIG